MILLRCKMKPLKVNVVVQGRRTSATVNPHVLDLLQYVDGQPSVQDLIDQAEHLNDYSPDGAISQWITALICQSACVEFEIRSRMKS